MIYTPLTKKAMKIAFEAHKNQTDKANIPYIYHPIHLAEQMPDETTTCVALLHDVVEDSNITLEELAKEGFPENVINALSLMTHDNTVAYTDYIKKIKENPVAVKVKLADLMHNSDLSRLDSIDEWAFNQRKKYENAISLLTDDK